MNNKHEFDLKINGKQRDARCLWFIQRREGICHYFDKM